MKHLGEPMSDVFGAEHYELSKPQTVPKRGVAVACIAAAGCMLHGL